MKSIPLWFAIVCSSIFVSGQANFPDRGGMLCKYVTARSAGSGKESIQAMTSDSAGNINIAGTASSPGLAMRNAAQQALAQSEGLDAGE